ncbi:MAG: polysaccharide biosynthesis/export family protein [Elusimicrobia bacterium]|nr:polysaccharide biosynthesis/export family protein [Elusimicrobiota bacterium]MDE2237219.1 polysaccharide biosynthesis/export family protein [Elusimicrobiota bacterium]MDE2426613.1 polysaccharide biosynthesis/export family protein [Elusimicrobiota bacterium]
MRLLRLLSPLIAAVLFCACASPARRSQAQEAQAASEQAAIASALSAANQKKVDYLISPADLLQVTIYGNKDLDRELRVSQAGTISFPLVGEVKIGGLTVIGAEDALAAKLSNYLVDPQVTVFIKEYGNKHVYVFGQVTKPGSYDIPAESHLTVLEAISMAGGFTLVAAPDRTKVIRNVDGKSQVVTVEVSAVTQRGEKNKDIPLQPNDVVYVPQSFF